MDIKDHLRVGITEGLKFRGINDKKYIARALYEYKIITAKEEAGFIDYFLVVSDLVRWAKDRGIAVGPGRGSAAGSLVCYLLRITEIDPLEYPMLFERFIDPERSDLPDIDIDFEDERRNEVFEYAANKYGREYVAYINTFTGYKSKNSLDDVARVYRIPEWVIEKIKSKLIERPEGHDRESDTIKDTIESDQELMELIDRWPTLEYAEQLEGNIRNFSIHAAGVVISSVPINEICATYTREGRTAIAYNKHDAAYLGLLKIDLLSLKTLSVLRIAMEKIGKKFSDLYELELNDERVLAEFGSGNVLGIFQFEGGTTRRICKDIKPERFQQLADINALARPGPLASGTTNDYIKRRFEPSCNWEYAHPIIKAHTEWTYGLIIYQEQILGILKDLGGFPPAAVNKIRNVIQYKLGEGAFNELYEEFVAGAEAQGLNRSVATDVWDRMVSSAGYSFNIAHSISYAKIAYWAMWLKVYYPPSFYVASLIKCGDGKDDLPRRQKLLREAKLKGLEVEPPDISVSQRNWDFYMDHIIAGFTQIKGIGNRTADRIIKWRSAKFKKRAIDATDYNSATKPLVWDDLKEVKGIGPKTIQTIKDFCESNDPFKLGNTIRILGSLRSDIGEGRLNGVPYPTHTSIEIAGDGRPICYMGIAQKIKYYDAIEQAQKRSKEKITREEAKEQIENPHLLKYCTIECEDEYGETVYIRVSRWLYPRYAGWIGKIGLGSDVVIAKGFSSTFGGISVQAKQIYIIDPYS